MEQEAEPTGRKGLEVGELCGILLSLRLSVSEIEVGLVYLKKQVEVLEGIIQKTVGR